MHTGCGQGGIESPVLFNIYMDFVFGCVEYDVLLKYPNILVWNIPTTLNLNHLNENDVVSIKIQEMIASVCSLYADAIVPNVI